VAETDQSDTDSEPSGDGATAVASPASAAGGKTAKGTPERIELGKREQALARRLAESKATVPHLYLEREVTLPGPAAASAARVIAATGRALARHRNLNGAYRDGALELHSRVNVGIFVEAPGGALVPTVFDADTKSVGEIEAEIVELADAARAGTLASPSLSGGTFTVTVLDDGADRVFAPVTPGQAAHLGVGRPRREAVAGPGGEVAAADVAGLTLSCDARAVRPPEAAAFLEELAGLLADPGDPGTPASGAGED
jgi:pyruvate dehydrogenase E2 component (dihydrolipoamide acetyltransferase)